MATKSLGMCHHLAVMPTDLNANVTDVTGPSSGTVPNETTDNFSSNCEIPHFKINKYCRQGELNQTQELTTALPSRASVKGQVQKDC